MASCNLFELDGVSEKLWLGNLEAAQLEGIRKPRVLAVYEWDQPRVRWRAELMTFVDEPTCSETPDIGEVVVMTDEWFRHLRQSLEVLATYSTERIAVRQDLVTRRIEERFGKGVDAVIENWAVVHGDIHWANVTYPGCWILDWESWGWARRLLMPHSCIALAYEWMTTQLTCIGISRTCW